MQVLFFGTYDAAAHPRVAVLRDGNVLRLASITLEVDQACSGIRSLMTLISVTTLIGYLFEPIWWRRAAVA